MAEIVAVTFKEGGKVYYFAPVQGEEYKQGDGVVVETARGTEFATVVIPRSEVDDAKLKLPLKPVLRAATARDIENHNRATERRGEAMKLAKEKIGELGLNMKLIDCEFAFDGSKATFYFSAPDRVDFRELVKELSSAFHLRIEMRQIGIRDEIKMLGGLAPCGRECCCSSYMSDIGKVSIKMAKYQGLSLNPTKISGLCGRLMCCLAYENEYYSEAYKQMPKIGSEISTPDGKGFVVNVNMLKMVVRVRIEDKNRDTVSFKDYTVDELNGKPAAPKEEAQAEAADVAPEPVQNRGEQPRRERQGGNNRDKNRDKNREKGQPNQGGAQNGNQGGNQSRRDKKNVDGRPRGGKPAAIGQKPQGNRPADGQRPQGERPQGEYRRNKNNRRHAGAGGGNQGNGGNGGDGDKK